MTQNDFKNVKGNQKGFIDNVHISDDSFLYLSRVHTVLYSTLKMSRKSSLKS